MRRNAALHSLGVYSVGPLATKTEILAEMYACFLAAILSRSGEGFVPPETTASSCGKKPGFSITLALLLWVVLIAPAFARDCHLARFEAQMSVARDGVVEVTERLDVVFDGTYQGIWRNIPLEYPGPHGSKYTLFLQVTRVTDGAGNDLKFDSTTQNGNRHLTINIPDAVNATRTVQIHYTVRNAVLWFDDHDELDWKVTGNDWLAPIASAAAHIVFPANSSGKLRAEAFTGEDGSRAQGATVQVGGNLVSVETTGPLSVREGLTVDVHIAKGVLTQPSQLTQAIWSVRNHFIVLPLNQSLLFLVLIVVFFVVFGFLTMTRNPFIERVLRLPNSEASNSDFSQYPPLNAADYPRTYRISLLWGAVHLILEVAAIGFGASTLRSALAGPQVRASWMMGILFILGGMLAMLYDLKYRVVLFADRIEVQSLVSTRGLRRDEILGRRLRQHQGPPSIQLVPRGEQRSVGVDLVLKTDAAFWAWINSLPDLDEP